MLTQSEIVTRSRSIRRNATEVVYKALPDSTRSGIVEGIHPLQVGDVSPA
jgi:hypothetical protein